MRHRESITVLAIVDDPPIGTLFGKVFGPIGDRVLVATDLAEGLALAASESPDIAFIDVSLGHHAGLALVHHLRAVAPAAAVYALARPESLAVGAQAAALGGAGLIMMPPSGDELATAASDVRSRLAAQTERRDLAAQADISRRGTAFALRISALAELTESGEAARALAAILAEATGARAVSVYLPASEGSNELMRSGSAGEIAGAPTFTDEMGLMAFAGQERCELLPLAVGQIAMGHALFAGYEHAPPRGSTARSALDLMAGQAAAMLALLGERERSTRGAIKDQTTSAYTFAYFVDIAGREIDKARRYGRRFALATIAIDEGSSAGSATELAEIVLDAVRDTDVLARVDEHEFYLLMPETGGLGAQSCRRRVLDRVGGGGNRRKERVAPAGLTVGVATYPHDGGDLSKLLRGAKRRAEAARSSLVRVLGLDTMGLAEIVDALLGHAASSSWPSDLETPRPFELPLTDAIGVGLAAVGDAMRGGKAVVAVAHQPGLGLSSSIRSSLGHDREGIALFSLDVRDVYGCEDLQALTVLGEHGAYVMVGRGDGGMLRAVHGADPLLADLVTQRLGEAGGARVLD